MFLKADQRTHLFFMGRKYPRFDDIAAVHAALVAAGAHRQPIAIARSPAPVPASASRKLSVVLSMMAELDDVELLDDRCGLRRADIDEAGLAALSNTYEARKDRDREKLDTMIAYAQSALCRWQLILRQFDETLDGEACGDCDNCRRSESRQQLAPAS